MDTYTQLQREIKVLLDKMRFNVVNTPTISMKDEVFFVNVFVDDPKLLIGYRGESLNEFQKILRLIFLKKYKKDIRIVVDVNGYKRKRQQTLKETALSGRIKALTYNKSVNLEKMNPYDRRIIHSTLTSFSDVSTVSRGIGRARFVSINPQKN